MNNILILGAGRSATVLIKYMLKQAEQNHWFVMVADINTNLVHRKVGKHPNARAVWLEVTRVLERRELIGRSDVVVSLLPPHLHIEVAYDCIALKKHLITASYVSKDIYKMSDEFRNKELIFMGVLGSYSGVDHMSVMRSVDAIKSRGARLQLFAQFPEDSLHRNIVIRTLGVTSSPGIPGMSFWREKVLPSTWKMASCILFRMTGFLKNFN